MEVAIVGFQQFLLDDTEDGDANEHSDCVVEHIGGEVPDAGVAVELAGELHGDGHVDDVGQELRYSLLGGVHRPDLPRSLGRLGVALVDQHAEGQRAEDQLHHDAGKADQLA